jgi:hypothetical protein
MERAGCGETKNTCKNVVKRHEEKTTQTQEQDNKMNITGSKYIMFC